VHGSVPGAVAIRVEFAYQNTVFQTQPVGMRRYRNPVATAAGTASVHICEIRG